jgi:hypothetical protein
VHQTPARAGQSRPKSHASLAGAPLKKPDLF